MSLHIKTTSVDQLEKTVLKSRITILVFPKDEGFDIRQVI